MSGHSKWNNIKRKKETPLKVASTSVASRPRISGSVEMKASEIASASAEIFSSGQVTQDVSAKQSPA